MRLPFVLSLLLLSQLSFAGPQAEPCASEILSQIEQRGARAVVQELYESHESWSALLKAISSGTPEWLEVAKKLKSGTDAGSTNMLEIAVFRALGQAPLDTLRLLASDASSWSSVCSSNFLIDDPADQNALNLIDKTIAELQNIKDPSVITTRDDCIHGLYQARQDALRIMKEPK
jgi:hypothetical protein